MSIAFSNEDRTSDWFRGIAADAIPPRLLRGILVLFLFLPSTIARSQGNQLEKKPNHLYVATFNVYNLGSIEAKYTSVEEETEEPLETGIPQRVQNLSNVLAVGGFDLIAIEEVTDGTPGNAAIGDLVTDLKTRHGLEYQFFLSDYVGKRLMDEAIAFVYNPAVVKPELLPGRTSLTENIEIDGRDLVRTQWEAGDFDFTVIAAHLAWGNEEDRDDG